MSGVQNLHSIDNYKKTLLNPARSVIITLTSFVCAFIAFGIGKSVGIAVLVLILVFLVTLITMVVFALPRQTSDNFYNGLAYALEGVR